MTFSFDAGQADGLAGYLRAADLPLGLRGMIDGVLDRHHGADDATLCARLADELISELWRPKTLETVQRRLRAAMPVLARMPADQMHRVVMEYAERAALLEP